MKLGARLFLFCFMIDKERVLKLVKNDHFFSIFSRFGLFREVFGQINE